ncbi:hypothetical protein KIH39_21810 [Telmatocola sphagniphila]|uniref:Peptidase M50 domain-containing protein n=1 Tax=Telmatocola sphagniphila TaxID=1123043 RepID=A0A8E6B501_9BACT|nr:site-2 protease family protein [Telmatocola sphagniphila]QVL31457.1 hypothetical protein KIH39_21810 [Telmatocola sphagniphila]
MREPMNWSLPLFRVFGISVNVHVFYIVMTLGLLLRACSQSPDRWLDFLLVSVVMLFVIILMHEFGHCFAARYVKGEADEILMWPLGGLAFCRPPMTPLAHFITAIGGPLVNFVFCLIAGTALLIGGFTAPMNPIRTLSAYDPLLYNFHDGRTYTTANVPVLVRSDTEREVNPVAYNFYPNGKIQVKNRLSDREWVDAKYLTTEPLPTWALWTARFFWLNLFLFCFNVFLPAFPLDGGRILQTIVWGRSDYEKGTLIACYAGQIVGMAMIILSIWLDYPISLLAIFIWYCSYMEMKKIYQPEGDGIYDTSKGYLAFEEGDVPVRRAPKQSFIKRWLQARAAKRIQREIEEQQADDARMDQLLEKLHRVGGRTGLTAEENRFLDRMAQRLRKKDE